MEQLDKEVIDELSESAKRVFRSLDYRSQRRMLKKAKEMGKQKKRKTQQKERIKKKSITKKKIKKEQAKERGTEIKDTSAKILQSMLLGTTMSEETYESNSEKQGDTTAGKVSAEVTQKSMRGVKYGVRSLYRKRQQKKMQKQAAKKKRTKYQTGDKKCIKSNSADRKDYDKHRAVGGGKSGDMDCPSCGSVDGSYCRCDWCCDWFRGCG